METSVDSVPVATSTNVIVTKEYVNGKFALNKLNGGLVFLTYKGTTGLPNRFSVRASSPKKFVTTDIINLANYEKSIRKTSTDEAALDNLVYLSTSKGFYGPIDEWLKQDSSNGNKWTIFGQLIWEYNGYRKVNIGPNLDMSGGFTIKKQVDASITEFEESFNYGR